MTEQAELTRRRSIYVRDEDQPLWDTAMVLADLFEEPLSVVVANALREYKPILAWQAANAAAKEAAKAARDNPRSAVLETSVV